MESGGVPKLILDDPADCSNNAPAVDGADAELHFLLTSWGAKKKVAKARAASGETAVDFTGQPSGPCG